MTTSQVPSTILQTLSEILANHSPQYAARLKQRLNAALEVKGENPFEERKYGFKGFRDFLSRGTQNLFSIEEAEEDVLISLAGSGAAEITVLRSDIWQAFTNPDVSRVRYLNRRTFVIRHFLRGESSIHASEVANASGDYVEIIPISSETQIEWMKQFIAEHQIDEPRREALLGIVGKPYTSGINAAFTGALGALGSNWRHLRFEKIRGIIQDWAAAEGIPTDKLSPRSAAVEIPSTLATAKTKGQVADRPEHSLTDGVSDPRQQAARLLEMLSDDDISRIVIPIVLSTLLVKGKM